MTDGSYRQDPLTPEERDEFEDDLLCFCDRELDLLGDIRGMDVPYAGGPCLHRPRGTRRAARGGRRGDGRLLRGRLLLALARGPEPEDRGGGDRHRPGPGPG